MGFIGKVKDTLSGGGSKSTFEDEFEGDSFEDEFEDDISNDEGDIDQNPEWDTAYQFADDVIEEVGFTDVKDFVDKAMIYRINQSPMYRDRIESGVQTMGMISESMRGIRDLRGEFDGDDGNQNYSEYVEEVRAANDLIDEIDRMEGKEEQIANEIIGVARDAVDAMKSQSGSSSVDSSVGVVEE